MCFVRENLCFYIYKIVYEIKIELIFRWFRYRLFGWGSGVIYLEEMRLIFYIVLEFRIELFRI